MANGKFLNNLTEVYDTKEVISYNDIVKSATVTYKLKIVDHEL